jgi:hypothetical protein
MKCNQVALLLLTTCTPILSASQVARPDIQVVRGLQFGTLVVNPNGGSVALTADGALMPDGVGVLWGSGPSSAAARFRLTGPPNREFTLSLDPRTPQLGPASGGALRVVEFLGSLPDLRGRFDAAGLAEFRLGAKLDIGAQVPPGLYTASQVGLQISVSGDSGVETIQRSFSISVQVRAPLTLANLGPLDFGALIPGTLPGVFEVFPGGGFRSQGAGGPTLLKGSPRPAVFAIQGAPGACYVIHLPSSATLTGSGSTMKVQGFTCDIPLSGQLSGSSTLFHVGGQLLVNPDQPHGLYRGTFSVEVCYP